MEIERIAVYVGENYEGGFVNIFIVNGRKLFDLNNIKHFFLEGEAKSNLYANNYIDKIAENNIKKEFVKFEYEGQSEKCFDAEECLSFLNKLNRKFVTYENNGMIDSFANYYFPKFFPKTITHWTAHEPLNGINVDKLRVLVSWFKHYCDLNNRS